MTMIRRGTDDTCIALPDPEFEIEKVVVGVPTPSATEVNKWTVDYEIEVRNVGTAEGVYALSDTLKFGDGAMVVDATVMASGMGDPIPGGTLMSNVNPDFDGLLDFEIIDSIVLDSGEVDTYMLSVEYMVVPSMVTDESADCELEPGELGTGLLNCATVFDYDSTATDSACTELPVPNIEVEKVVSAEPTPTDAINQWMVSYEVIVTNENATGKGWYWLLDTLKYGDGAMIDSIQLSHAGTGVPAGGGIAGDSINDMFDGVVNTNIVTDTIMLGVDETDTYTLKVFFSIDPSEVTEESRNCDDSDDAGDNTGLLNCVEVNDGDQTMSDTACTEIPDPNIRVEKMVMDVPTATDNINQWYLTYQVVVTNDGTAKGWYALSDTLMYGEGANPIADSVSVMYVGGDGMPIDLENDFDGVSQLPDCR